MLPRLLTTVLLKVSFDISILYILRCSWEGLGYNFNVRSYKSSEKFIAGQLTCKTLTFLRDIDIYHITDGKSSFLMWHLALFTIQMPISQTAHILLKMQLTSSLTVKVEALRLYLPMGPTQPRKKKISKQFPMNISGNRINDRHT